MTNKAWQDKFDQATVLSELARISWAKADYEKANECLLKALNILEEEFGPDRIPQVKILHSLGLLSRVRVKYADSKKYYLRALSICETLLGPDALATASRLNYLAGLYNAQGEYARAEELLSRSLSIYQKQLGPVNQATALTLMALAILCMRQKKEAEARAYREEMRQINEQLESAKDDVKTALSKLADFFFSQGRLDDADLVFRYGLILGEEQEFPQHPFVGESLLGLARLYADYEAWSESAALYKRAISCWEKLAGPNSPEALSSMKECAQVLKRLNCIEEAKALEAKAASFH